MSSTVTAGPARSVRGIGLVAIIAGIVMVLAGILVWILVATQLAAEKITVSDGAGFLGGMFQGDAVRGPLTAFAQADIINEHALSSTGGLTYAQLAQDDPGRETVMTASFLRASLFTSVVAFGICALVIGLGILFVLVGTALRRLAGVSTLALAGAGPITLTGDGDRFGRHSDPGTTRASAPEPPTDPGPPTA